MSVLIFTGKGGVGKTTCAAATALRAAASGKRVLVVSSDPAHSLGDCLDIPLSSAPQAVSQGLYAMEIDARAEMRSRFGDVRKTIVDNMKESGLEAPLAAEMVEFPGAEELFALLRIAEIRRERSFDVVIMDCAPTGNTLRFLNFSEFLSPLKRALKLERLYNRITSPVSRMFGKQHPTDAYYDAIFDTFQQIEETRAGMRAADTRFRVVMNPERLSIAESQRAVSFLNVGGFVVDAIIVNRVLPEGLRDPFFDDWKRAHARHVGEIRQQFFPLRIIELPLERHEIIGLERIARLAEQMYGELDPAAPLTEERPFELEAEQSGFSFRVRMPSVSKAELHLAQDAEGVHVRIGPYERRIHLPSALLGRAVASAQYDGQFLTLRFADSPA